MVTTNLDTINFHIQDKGSFIIELDEHTSSVNINWFPEKEVSSQVTLPKILLEVKEDKIMPTLHVWEKPYDKKPACEINFNEEDYFSDNPTHDLYFVQLIPSVCATNYSSSIVLNNKTLDECKEFVYSAIKEAVDNEIKNRTGFNVNYNEEEQEYTFQNNDGETLVYKILKKVYF